MNDDLRKRVQAWLQKTGYPLEMRVANEARRADPLWVDQSRNYVDSESGKLRETDVVAGWGERGSRGGGHVYLVMECKAKPAPWVVFDDGQLPTDDADLRLWWAARRSPTDGLGNSRDVRIRSGAFCGDTLLQASRVGLAAVEVTFADKPAERNAAWDAVRSAVSAAHGVLAEFDEAQLERNQAVLIGVPVVVTTGALFRAFLDGDDMSVEEVDRAEVTVRFGAQLDEARCLIVREPALPNLFAEAHRTAGVLTLAAG